MELTEEERKYIEHIKQNMRNCAAEDKARLRKSMLFDIAQREFDKEALAND